MRYLPIIAIEMILASALAIVLYWWDKRLARKNAGPSSDRYQRIPERTLLVVSLIGGWPGAWWASQKFRHKTQKRSFRVRFWIAVLINVAVIMAVLVSF